MEPIYGPKGDVVAWLERPDCIRNLGGEVIGWLYDDAVHGLRGQHVGYFNTGLFRDHYGAVVAWINGASGGPTKPVTQIRPVQSIKHVRPVKSVREVLYVRAVRSSSWSRKTISEYLPKP